MEILQEVIVSVVIIIIILYVSKEIKKANTSILKFVVSLISIIILTPLFVFYGDLFDIPTKLGWNISNNTKEWLGNYFTEIIAVIIGSAFTIFITIHEIRENSKNDRKNNNENLRIENLPLIRFDLGNKTLVDREEIPTVLETNIDDEDGIIQSIYLRFKNIGLNTARNISIIINSDILEEEYILRISDQMLLEKNEEIVKEFLLTLMCNCSYTFNIKIYFQDLLFNNYEQEVILKYYLSSVCNGDEHKYTYEFERKNEKQIDSYQELHYNEKKYKNKEEQNG